MCELGMCVWGEDRRHYSTLLIINLPGVMKKKIVVTGYETDSCNFYNYEILNSNVD